MTLTKEDLALSLHDRLGFSKKESKEMVDRFFDEILKALEGGEEVQLSHFGHFRLRDKRERPGRNPKTGEPTSISARRVVTFHPSRRLSAAVNRARRPPQSNAAKDKPRSITEDVLKETTAEEV